jgi:hypothetical protein
MLKTSLFILLVSFISHDSLSKTKVINKKNQKEFKEYFCKQKTLPIEVNYLLNDKFIELELSFQKEIKQFKILSIRGIDGLTITNPPRFEFKDVKPRQKDLTRIDYNKDEGLGYIVIEFVGQVHGLQKIQVISISVGELSPAQQDLRDENIVEINSTLPSGPFNRSVEKKEKVHRIKLQE